MDKKPYHHGNLQTELIEEGLALIHEQGIGDFSLRKLSKRVGVSPTACYNHYPNIESLLAEMKLYVTNKFSEALKSGSQCGDQRYCAISMGKSYVNFFAVNPHYFSFIYDNEDYHIELTQDKFQGDFEPFTIFKETAIKSMEICNIKEEDYLDNLVVMWATVHGLAAMANMKGFHYNGDWGTLTDTILKTKLLLD